MGEDTVISEMTIISGITIIEMTVIMIEEEEAKEEAEEEAVGEVAEVEVVLSSAGDLMDGAVGVEEIPEGIDCLLSSLLYFMF